MPLRFTILRKTGKVPTIVLEPVYLCLQGLEISAELGGGVRSMINIREEKSFSRKLPQATQTHYANIEVIKNLFERCDWD